MARDAAERLLLALGFRVLHVGAHLGDVHPAIAIEGDHHGLGDVGLGQYGFEVVAAGHLHGRDAGGGGQSLEGRGRRGGSRRGSHDSGRERYENAMDGWVHAAKHATRAARIVSISCREVVRGASSACSDSTVAAVSAYSAHDDSTSYRK